MNPSPDTNSTETLFAVYALQTGVVKEWSAGVTKELMTCFLTIREYWEQLYDENIDFAFGLTQDYTWNVVRVDFNTVVKYLNQYDGEVIGVQEATEQMKKANVKLYGILGTFEEQSPHSLSERLEKRAEAWTECREFVQAAYDHLKHLEPEAVNLGLLPGPAQGTNTT